MAEDMWVCIMAGGSGTRFWPLSRRRRPKQLLKIVGPRPLLRLSVDRILPLVGPERVLVVANQAYGQAVRDLLAELPPENIVLEPVGRNTAAACGLGAWWVKQRAGGGVMAVLPADHLISDEESFREDLRAAGETARSTDRLITFGLAPTRPETGFGYLEKGPQACTALGREVFELAAFREKPDSATAQEYLASGKHFWNSGIFVWEAEAILARIEEQMPALGQGLAELAPHLLSPDQEAALGRLYPTLPADSIDYGVMEKAAGKQMIEAGFDWSDLGSWEAVHQFRPKDSQGNSLSGAGPGKVLAIDARDNLVEAGEKQVVLLGVEGLAVVECEDALLVMDRSRSQEVRRIIEALASQGREDLT